MPQITKTLEDATPEDLLSALRGKGYAVTAFYAEDMREILNQDPDFNNLSEDEMDRACELAFEHSVGKLDDILSERGNEHLADGFSYGGKDATLAELASTPKL